MREFIGWGAGSMAIKIRVLSEKSLEECESVEAWLDQADDVEWIKTDCEELEHVEEVWEVGNE